MLKQILLGLVFGLLATSASFAQNKISITHALDKHSDLRKADDFCITRIDVLYKAAAKQLKDQPAEFSSFAKELGDVGKNLNADIEIAAQFKGEENRTDMIRQMRERCTSTTEDLREKLPQSQDVKFKDEESFFDELMDFFNSLMK